MRIWCCYYTEEKKCIKFNSKFGACTRREKTHEIPLKIRGMRLGMRPTRKNAWDSTQNLGHAVGHAPEEKKCMRFHSKFGACGWACVRREKMHEIPLKIWGMRLGMRPTRKNAWNFTKSSGIFLSTAWSTAWLLADGGRTCFTAWNSTKFSTMRISCGGKVYRMKSSLIWWNFFFYRMPCPVGQMLSLKHFSWFILGIKCGQRKCAKNVGSKLSQCVQIGHISQLEAALTTFFV